MSEAPAGSDDRAFDRERFISWSELERRKLELAEREQSNRDLELKLRQHEQLRTRWSSPLVVAILAAAAAGISNAVITMVNGSVQSQIEREKAEKTRDLEEAKAEATRILEMIKTGNPDIAAKNLEFLAETGLLADKQRLSQLKTYLGSRAPGTGPSLPAPGGTTAQRATLHPPDPEVLERLTHDLKGEEKKWMDLAIKEIGIQEPDPRISLYFESTSMGSQPPSVPWSSAFVNFIMKNAGYMGTGSALNRSWLNWGKDSERRVGAIVVFQTGASSASVGFYVGENKDNHQILVLGGNIYDQVTIAAFPNDRVLGMRWPAGDRD